MIHADDDNGQWKQLTSHELAEVRECLGMRVPWSILARQKGIDEQELRRQLGLPVLPTTEPEPVLFNPRKVAQERVKRRQIEALRERFGSGHE